MKINHQVIKGTVEFAYKQIKEAEATLKEMREKCDHPKTEFVTYSTRPGQYWDNTEICSICGEVVKWAYEGMDIKIESNEDYDENDPGWLANRNHG